jgi:acyl carrier protein
MNDTLKISHYIHQLLKDHGHTENVAPTDSLILSGLLDSLAVIHIIVFLETHFGIDFSEVYFDQTNFDSIESIFDFVTDNRPREKH